MTVDPTTASSCLARNACRQHDILCSPACPLYLELRYQLALSNIPLEYRGITAEALDDDRENLEQLRKFAGVAASRHPNNGLYLWGVQTGNGKTEAACAVAQSYILARTKQAINEGKSIGRALVQFVGTTELFELLRQAMDEDSAKARAAKVTDRIERADVVILDDFSAERVSEWVVERFYSLLNGIWANRSRQTLIVTSNRSLDQIELWLDKVGIGSGARIRSRIDGLTVALEFRGNDRRRKKR